MHVLSFLLAYGNCGELLCCAELLLHMLAVQGSTECRQVAGQVAASVAYHLLNGCKAHKEAEAADWLAKLDMALLQAAVPQPGATIKASYPCTVP